MKNKLKKRLILFLLILGSLFWASNVIGIPITIDAIVYQPDDNFVGAINSKDVVVAFGSPTAIPEPSTAILIGIGLIGIATIGRKNIFKK